ncbi:hypothetical protein ABBQ32_012564 [Trebouxia sp. C0010 RCD-2024]
MFYEGRVKAVNVRWTLSKRPNNPARADFEQRLPQAERRALPSMPFTLATASGMPPLFKDACGATAADTAAAAAEADPITK